MEKKIPVILHTDIGTDIDDSWALLMLLRQNQLDLKMVLCDTGDVRYRAALTAASLTAFGRPDIPIGMGCTSKVVSSCAEALNGTELDDYKGGIYEDGVAKLIEIIRNTDETVTLLSIGPAPAIQKALEIAPEIAPKVRFVGMFGSYKLGYCGKAEIAREYNVVHNIEAAKAVFAAPWREAVITPLDTCGIIILKEDHYRRLEKSKNPAIQTLLDHYRLWRKSCNQPEAVTESSILYDTVAVHLVSSTEFLEMEEVHMLVNDEGYTKESEEGRTMKVAVRWSNMEAYKDFLVDTLLS